MMTDTPNVITYIDPAMSLDEQLAAAMDTIKAARTLHSSDHVADNDHLRVMNL